MRNIKLIILILLCSGILVSCGNLDNTNKVIIRDKDGYTLSVKQGYEFSYKNHDYISFGLGKTSSVVHNPDCKTCNERKNNIIEDLKKITKTDDPYNW